MKTIKLLAFALFATTASFAQQAEAKPATVQVAPQTPSQLKWEKDTHEFGTIERNKPVSYEFTFTNTTKKDVLLKDVKASCGCTTPNWTKGVIKPGEKGTVIATYNAASPGAFHKTITVTTSEENTSPKILTIKGTVQAEETPAPAAK